MYKFLFCLVLLSVSGKTFSQDFKARICKDCNYSEAKEIAKKLTPELVCQRLGMNPDEQQCYSTTNKVLVVNQATREIFAFYNGYSNQGRPPYEMHNTLRDMSSYPAAADTLINDVLDAYAQLDEIAAQVTADFNQGAMPNSTEKLKFSTYSATSVTNSTCENSPESKAVSAMLNGRNMANVQNRAQEYASQKQLDTRSFHKTRFTGVNFGVSAGGVSVGGTWEYIPVNRSVIQYFTQSTDVPVNYPRNQVAYELSLDTAGFIGIALNKTATIFDGVSLAVLKQTNFSASQLSNCLTELLDKNFPKSISSPGGGASGTPAGSGSATVGWGNIPVSSGNGGGGASFETCLHHYFDRNGALLASIAGACP
jgi:hypothetical protein